MEQNKNAVKAVNVVYIQKSEQEVLSMIAEYEQSGFTVKDFCKASDVSESTFHAWLRKYLKPVKMSRSFEALEP